MRIRFLSILVVSAALTAAVAAQDTAPAGQSGGQGPGGGYGQRGGRGYGGGFGGGMMGRGLTGTVTEVGADHYTIKTDTGDVYTVHLSSDTQIVKRQGGMRGQGGGPGGRGNTSEGMGRGNPPEALKVSDVKVGDMITAMGETDATAKTVSARMVALMDPQAAEQMRQMQANFGKTWLAGKVTAIDGTKITLTGAMDNAAHVVVVDENTSFRKHRDPVTLADIQVGDTVRVDGALKDGVFAATGVNVGGMMGGGPPTAPRNPPPQ